MASTGSNSNNNGRPLKLASNRTPKTPLAPRLAAHATLPRASPASIRAAAIRSEPATLRTPPTAKQDAETPINNVFSTGNITPRSSARKSRVDSPQLSPIGADDITGTARPRSTIPLPSSGERNSNGGSIVSNGYQSKVHRSRPKSLVSDSGTKVPSPLVRSPGFIDLGRPSLDDSIDSRFFHASDVKKQETAQKKEPAKPVKKEATFFYADGQEEKALSPALSPQATSPVLSAVSEKRTGSRPWLRADGASNPSRSPPMLSPALSSLSSTPPFFPAPSSNPPRARSPSPSKENIHLSYRKGASQIIGMRPERPSAPAALSPERRESVGTPANPRIHAKSPSLSSIDSGNSHQSRRRSATTAEILATPSPLAQQQKATSLSRPSLTARGVLPSIDTSIESPSRRSPPPEAPMSPTKSVSEMAADARRERKVLDLEISNSSLLAINTSLEREVRRQKAELKRFRRLSRAGRFSTGPSERSARLSEGLSTLGEEDGDGGFDAFGPPSGLTDLMDPLSDDDDDESLVSSAEPLSPTAMATRDADRLAKDEKRLQVDLAKHKELLVQSQMMNQSLKRCMYSTEEMIKDGKKALEYQVRVSDVKLGGKILSGDEDAHDGESVHAEDETLNGDSVAGMKGFLEVWTGQNESGRHSFESERTDRDSGIEVDKPPESLAEARLQIEASNHARPPDVQGGAIDGVGERGERPKLHWLHSIS